MEAAPELPAGLTPYFAGEGCWLFHGNALDVLWRLPPAIARAFITDPPYSSGGLSAAERSADPRVKYCHGNHDCGRPTFQGDNRDQRSYRFWSTLWACEAQRLVGEGGYCLIFTDWRQLPVTTDVLQAGGFVWRGIVNWNKGRGARAPHKGYFRHQCEYVVWGTNGRCRQARHGGPWDGCFEEHIIRSDKHHMTGKPTAVMRRLVQPVEPGGLVIDAFAGSGTTAVACVLEGRRFLGVEQSEAYCEIAARRIEAALAGRSAAAAA